MKLIYSKHIQRMSSHLKYNIFYEIAGTRGPVLLHIRKVLRSHLGPEAVYPDVSFCGFPPALQTHITTAPQTTLTAPPSAYDSFMTCKKVTLLHAYTGTEGR